MKSKGILYIIASAFFFSLMAVFVKSVPELPLSQKMFFRNAVGLVAISITLFRNHSSIIPRKPKLMFLRAFFGLLGVGFYYAAIERLPLADAVILNKLAPIFVAIFAVIFLKETLLKHQKYALVLALIGAVFIVNPQFSLDIIPAIFGVLSGLFAGAAYTTIRKLTAYDSPALIVFYFCAFSSAVMIPFMMVEGFVIPSLAQLMILCGIGVSALIAQLFMTHAYKQAHASEIAIYAYSDTLFSVAIGFFIWNEHPSVLTLVGGICIIGAGLLHAYIPKSSKSS